MLMLHAGARRDRYRPDEYIVLLMLQAVNAGRGTDLTSVYLYDYAAHFAHNDKHRAGECEVMLMRHAGVRRDMYRPGECKVTLMLLAGAHRED